MIRVVVPHDNFGDMLYEVILHVPFVTDQTIGWVTRERKLMFISPQLPAYRYHALDDRIFYTFQDVEDLKENLWLVFI